MKGELRVGSNVFKVLCEKLHILYPSTTVKHDGITFIHDSFLEPNAMATDDPQLVKALELSEARLNAKN